MNNKLKTIWSKIQPNNFNSGTEIEKIRQKIIEKQNENDRKLLDFSKFPLYGTKIEDLMLTNIEPISFNNKEIIFYSKDEINKLGYKNIIQLRNKFVTYDIVTDLAKHYFGHTGDYGERIGTHDKDGRSDERELYYDLRKYKRAIIRPLHICSTEKEAIEFEEEYIREFIYQAIKTKYPQINVYDLEWNQIKQLAKEFCYNINLVKNVLK